MNQVKGDYINSPRMAELMKDYCPMFGYKTSTVVIDTDRYNKVGHPQKLKLKDPQKHKEIFMDEMAERILINPEMAFFYRNMLNVLNYDKATKQIDPSYLFNEIGLADREIDPVVREMVTAVMTYQINEMQKVVNKKLADYKVKLEEEENAKC